MLSPTGRLLPRPLLLPAFRFSFRPVPVSSLTWLLYTCCVFTGRCECLWDTPLSPHEASCPSELLTRRPQPASVPRGQPAPVRAAVVVEVVCGGGHGRVTPRCGLHSTDDH